MDARLRSHALKGLHPDAASPEGENEMPLLAHTGGFSWDEGLVIVAPLLLLGLVLLVCRFRVRRQPPPPEEG